MALYKVEICGVNTSKLPLLKNSEKEELFQRILNGDKEARELYIKGNLRLVLSIIQRFSNSNENVDDLFQIGCIGLMKAIDNFDITQNVKFSTYAVPMIIGEIRRHLRDHHALRVSRSLRDIAYKAMQAKEQWITDNLREPTIEEIAEMIGKSRRQTSEVMNSLKQKEILLNPEGARQITENGRTVSPRTWIVNPYIMICAPRKNIVQLDKLTMRLFQHSLKNLKDQNGKKVNLPARFF